MFYQTTFFAVKPQPARKYFETLFSFLFLNTRMHHHMQLSVTDHCTFVSVSAFGNKNCLAMQFVMVSVLTEIRKLLCFQFFPVNY